MARSGTASEVGTEPNDSPTVSSWASSSILRSQNWCCSTMVISVGYCASIRFGITVSGSSVRKVT